MSPSTVTGTTGADRSRAPAGEAVPGVLGTRPTWIPKLGLWSWSFVGAVGAVTIVVLALGAVSEIVLPLTFAAVLAIIFKPAAGTLERHGFRPTYAAGLVVLGLLALMVLVVVATVRGIVEQADQIGAATDHALDYAADQLAAVPVDPAALADARAATTAAGPMIGEGFVTHLVSGVGTLIGVASGLILGALIMYYLLKDGTALRRGLVARMDTGIRADVDGFIGDSCRALRDYGRGRTILSAIVALIIGAASLLLGLPLVFTIMVVNFIGGYIPYIGAFIGGGLAVVVALGDGGLGRAAIMLGVVLASNLVLENFVEPKVMGRTLDLHPLVVLIVTALGGLLGGIVGLILAVPAFVLARDAINRLQSGGVVDLVADRAEPTVQRLLE